MLAIPLQHNINCCYTLHKSNVCIISERKALLSYALPILKSYNESQFVTLLFVLAQISLTSWILFLYFSCMYILVLYIVPLVRYILVFWLCFACSCIRFPRNPYHHTGSCAMLWFPLYYHCPRVFIKFFVMFVHFAYIFLSFEKLHISTHVDLITIFVCGCYRMSGQFDIFSYVSYLFTRMIIFSYILHTLIFVSIYFYTSSHISQYFHSFLYVHVYKLCQRVGIRMLQHVLVHGIICFTLYNSAHGFITYPWMLFVRIHIWYTSTCIV